MTTPRFKIICLLTVSCMMMIATAQARQYFIWHADSGTTSTRESDAMDHTNLERLSAGDRLSASALTVTMNSLIDGEGAESGYVNVTLELWESTWVLDMRENSNKLVWITDDVGLQVNIGTISPVSKTVGMRIMKIDKPAPKPGEEPIVPPKIAKMRADREKAARQAAQAPAAGSSAAPASGVAPATSGSSGTQQIRRTLRPGDSFRVGSLTVKFVKLENPQRDPKAVIDARTGTSQKQESIRERYSMKIEGYEIFVDDIRVERGEKDEVNLKIIY